MVIDMNKPRVELHLHTAMSTMDGINVATEYINAAIYEKMPAIAITDHASVQAFPEAYSTMRKYRDMDLKLKLIYGNEIYLVDDKVWTANSETHASILVLNEEGLKNLYKLVSLANTEYFYKLPRTPKSVLAKHREGLLIGSGCDCGELYRAVRDGKPLEELSEIAEFYDYLEVVPVSNFEYYIEKGYAKTKDDLIEINKKIVELGDKTAKLVVAVSDAHYVHEDDAICRKIIMHSKGYENYRKQPNLSMRTTDEMLADFAFLGKEKAYEIVVENTNRIADMADELFPPIDLEADYTADAEKLKNFVAEKALKKYGENIHSRIKDRIDWELSSICQNELSVYNFLIGIELICMSAQFGWTTGNRGSVASSLVAHLLGISEINPLEAHFYCPKCHYIEFHDEYYCGVDMDDKTCECGAKLKKDGFTIPPETFFGIDGSCDVDIDYNFAPEYQEEAMNHLKELVGGMVVRCGTIGTISHKTACNMTDNYCDAEEIEINTYKRDEIVGKISQVKRTTGMHPGGMLIIPNDKDIYDYTPVQHPANSIDSGIITTHFDFRSLCNILKIDILAHDMYSMLKKLEELTNVSSKYIPLDDKETIQLFNEGNTEAVPEFCNLFVKDIVMPAAEKITFDTLIRISGLSHGTGVWTENGENLIKKGKSISDIISCRDDVMLFLLRKGIDRETAYKISERIRKGKGLTVDQYFDLRKYGLEKWRLNSWNKIKYLFPRAHAASYVLCAYRIAYYKAHYPQAFYKASAQIT